MSVYSREIIRCNGDLKVYVRLQNDWSGQITEGLRNIFSDGNRKYFRAEGCEHDVTTMIEDFRRAEDQIKEALKWYKQTKF